MKVGQATVIFHAGTVSCEKGEIETRDGATSEPDLTGTDFRGFASSSG